MGFLYTSLAPPTVYPFIKGMHHCATLVTIGGRISILCQKLTSLADNRPSPAGAVRSVGLDSCGMAGTHLYRVSVVSLL